MNRKHDKETRSAMPDSACGGEKREEVEKSREMDILVNRLLDFAADQ